ncbi:formamidopyrimidine-DNA glycosylase [Gemmatirosa kalamazoonensis]|uniref:Formamidopyrimidine-DNA glycosylase n=1 Tax=Gemmatirosa kalamazoonensis TaxID=861299 RepID=W0RL42_9BACT|nr:bifunctional DNA-formamidopyrimidine glycosylase/DNA-(apurinic or apyrimidinic site) lyase [Gemmatirosa kalamazoonensis]AHG90153.1 formamidopyrimidine-DNA glycosylase [Gemmatirosa kalamazoonensis]
MSRITHFLMPELPEVEAAARLLREVAVGRTIRAVHRSHAATRRALPDDAVTRLVGRRVTSVERRGKHQLLTLDDGAVVHAHFRMNGDWHVGSASDEPPRHARAALDFDDGLRLTLVDSRALATLSLHSPGASPLPTLGPEPTDAGFDAASLGAALRGRRGPIKPVLLDQRVVAGLGNIYAAEALWRARVSPRAPANGIGPARLARLAAAMRDVLTEAIEKPGRYRTGEAAVTMHVYDREGEPCTRCGTMIRRIVQAGRSTYFCPRCQAR